MRLSRWDRKVVQGATVAAATTAGAAVAMALIRTEPEGFFSRVAWAFSNDIYTSVGLPAFLAGLVFFPVGLKALSSRFGFALRAALTAAGVSLINRVLVFASYEGGGNLWEGLKALKDSPELLWPSPFDTVAMGLDWNAILGLTATALAGGLAWAAQPLMKRIARQPRFSPIAEIESQPLGVPARARVR